MGLFALMGSFALMGMFALVGLLAIVTMAFTVCWSPPETPAYAVTPPRRSTQAHASTNTDETEPSTSRTCIWRCVRPSHPRRSARQVMVGFLYRGFLRSIRTRVVTDGATPSLAEPPTSPVRDRWASACTCFSNFTCCLTVDRVKAETQNEAVSELNWWRRFVNRLIGTTRPILPLWMTAAMHAARRRTSRLQIIIHTPSDIEESNRRPSMMKRLCSIFNSRPSAKAPARSPSASPKTCSSPASITSTRSTVMTSPEDTARALTPGLDNKPQNGPIRAFPALSLSWYLKNGACTFNIVADLDLATADESEEQQEQQHNENDVTMVKNVKLHDTDVNTTNQKVVVETPCACDDEDKTGWDSLAAPSLTASDEMDQTGWDSLAARSPMMMMTTTTTTTLTTNRATKVTSTPTSTKLIPSSVARLLYFSTVPSYIYAMVPSEYPTVVFYDSDEDEDDDDDNNGSGVDSLLGANHDFRRFCDYGNGMATYQTIFFPNYIRQLTKTSKQLALWDEQDETEKFEIDPVLLHEILAPPATMIVNLDSNQGRMNRFKDELSTLLRQARYALDLLASLIICSDCSAMTSEAILLATSNLLDVEAITKDVFSLLDVPHQVLKCDCSASFKEVEGSFRWNHSNAITLHGLDILAAREGLLKASARATSAAKLLAGPAVKDWSDIEPTEAPQTDAERQELMERALLKNVVDLLQPGAMHGPDRMVPTRGQSREHFIMSVQDVLRIMQYQTDRLRDLLANKNNTFWDVKDLFTQAVELQEEGVLKLRLIVCELRSALAEGLGAWAWQEACCRAKITALLARYPSTPPEQIDQLRPPTSVAYMVMGMKSLHLAATRHDFDKAYEKGSKLILASMAAAMATSDTASVEGWKASLARLAECRRALVDPLSRIALAYAVQKGWLDAFAAQTAQRAAAAAHTDEDDDDDDGDEDEDEEEEEEGPDSEYECAEQEGDDGEQGGAHLNVWYTDSDDEE